MWQRTSGVSASPPRCALVWLAATAAATALAVLLVPGLPDAPAALTQASGLPFDRRLVGLSSVVALATGAWLWLGTTLVALEAWRGAVTARCGLPAGVRRLVLGACGVALAGGLSTPAIAAGGPPADGGRPAAVLLAGLPLPERPVGAATRPARVVVRAGDSLWALAARSLPAGADDAAVAARWHRVYERNRDRIGPDPDLIHPGQPLRLPRR
jgi:LysM domain-containing protein